MTEKASKDGAGEMAQQLKEPASLAEDPGCSSTTWRLTTISTSSSKTSNILLWRLQAPGIDMFHKHNADTHSDT